MTKSTFEQQIANTENRYESRSAYKIQHQENSTVGRDWRQVETPERLMNRITTLGLHELGSHLIASDDATHLVPSSINPDTQVSPLERIIEENDLISSRFLKTGADVARAVGRITLRSQGRNVGYGTGFLISSELILTNHHILTTADIAADSFIEFDFFERQNGMTSPTVVHRLQPNRFFLNDESLDYAIVAINPQSEDGLSVTDRGFIPLIKQSGKALVGELVNIIQHPEGQPQQVALRNNEITDVFENFLHYSADTEQGSSGSPVLNMQWQLTALHHSGVPKKNSQGQILMVNGQVFDGQPENEGRIAWKANEGVRISSIVKDVQKKLSGTTNRQASELFGAAVTTKDFLGLTSLKSSSPAELASTTTETPRSLKKEYSDEELDRLTPEEISTLLSEMDTRFPEVTHESTEITPTLVAEGDSWFDYAPAGLDVISSLKKFFNYKIHNVSQAGDTLDNMAWGTKFKQRRWTRNRPPLEETLRAIQKHRPPIVLLSGGGNDIAGEELFSFLNHKQSGLPALRKNYTDFILKDYFLRVFSHISNEIWNKDEEIYIVLHGYGHPVPDGRSVVNILGFKFIGPWLKPSLVAKGYEQFSDQKQIMSELVDDFNSMLAQFAASDSRLHYIDLRPLIQDTDWINELHLKNSAYRRVANKFDQVIRPLL